MYPPAPPLWIIFIKIIQLLILFLGSACILISIPMGLMTLYLRLKKTESLKVSLYFKRFLRLFLGGVGLLVLLLIVMVALNILGVDLYGFTNCPPGGFSEPTPC